jgi:hypothetical protein
MEIVLNLRKKLLFLNLFRLDNKKIDRKFKAFILESTSYNMLLCPR